MRHRTSRTLASHQRVTVLGPRRSGLAPRLPGRWTGHSEPPRLLPVAAVAAALLLPAVPLAAQSQADLERFFEGKTVVVRVPMPATKNGVDVHPRRTPAIDYTRYGRRLKEHGTALRPGDRVIVTKVKAKERHIEFQLGGGGYGTAADETGEVYATHEGPSRREKDLKKAIDAEKDPARKAELRKEYEELKRERERANELRDVLAAQATEHGRATARSRALDAGSRFNIRYEGPLTSAALTPATVMDALSDYLEFPAESFGEGVAGAGTAGSTTSGVGAPPAAGPASGSGSGSEPPRGASALRKGLTWEEVAALLGAPDGVSEQSEGSLKVLICTFTDAGRKIEAEFVEGVLIRYRVSSG